MNTHRYAPALLRALGLLVTAAALASCQSKLPGTVMSRADLSKQVMKQLPRKAGAKPTVMASDNIYLSVQESEAFHAYQDSITYEVADTDDCDDLAFSAKAKIIKKQQNMHFNGLPAAFGMAWTPKHVFNVFMDDAQKLRVMDRDGSIGGPELFSEPVSLIVF
jgi:hypothetical protein